jgi:ABC-type sulfate transport system permease subunit
MAEHTVLVVPGKKLSVPRILKRILQIAIAVALTSAVFLVMIVGNGLVVGRNASLQSGMNAWLAFIQRPDILATIWVTALVTVLVVYWMRDRERQAGGSSRMQS